MSKLTRTSSADLEIRGSDGRTVVGIAVPFSQPTEIRDYSGEYTETFQRGAFERTIRERGSKVKFLVAHDRLRLPIGRATLLREDTSGLYSEFRVSKTESGDEVLELIRDGALDALSIGFQPIRDLWSNDRRSVTRTEVKLVEVSAVSFPAFEGAQILGVRQRNPRIIDADNVSRRLRLLDL
ncbi:HK97 family phage prohead protease [Rhodococcus sp. HM1]|uniref:HK97 family phage prohead protease n=1 Tax=Rhodococcus sp. HM1 TaxID=2937759 RepID=UPI00200A8376|nr:HK97 family phage prohead protease [Rhodococcus sp. HM1]MCK8673281.1 HK97 family phage prohead protease [Rhodococcus sp. HM1]